MNDFWLVLQLRRQDAWLRETFRDPDPYHVLSRIKHLLTFPQSEERFWTSITTASFDRLLLMGFRPEDIAYRWQRFSGHPFPNGFVYPVKREEAVNNIMLGVEEYLQRWRHEAPTYPLSHVVDMLVIAKLSICGALGEGSSLTEVLDQLTAIQADREAWLAKRAEALEG